MNNMLITTDMQTYNRLFDLAAMEHCSIAELTRRVAAFTHALYDHPTDDADEIAAAMYGSALRELHAYCFCTGKDSDR